jgi:hypothetical protein
MISQDELTKIENTLVTVRKSLDESSTNSPEGQKIMQMLVEAEQICSAKLDKGGTATTESGSGGSPYAPKAMA